MQCDECSFTFDHPFLPVAEQATGAAVLIAPGGGHRMLCLGHEGYSLAEWLADHGIAAFVLKYRLAREEGSTYTVDDHAMADTRRALRMIRARAEEWKIDPERIGIMGFSAGGELAALAAMNSDPGTPSASDPIERQSSRPAFQALIYPGSSKRFTVSSGMPPPSSPSAITIETTSPSGWLNCISSIKKPECQPSCISIPMPDMASDIALEQPPASATGIYVFVNGLPTASCLRSDLRLPVNLAKRASHPSVGESKNGRNRFDEPELAPNLCEIPHHAPPRIGKSSFLDIRHDLARLLLEA